MCLRPVWLAKFRNAPSQHAHFAIFTPNCDDASKDPNDRSVPCTGTLINVVGAPMTGYVHEVKHDYSSLEANDLEKAGSNRLLEA